MWDGRPRRKITEGFLQTDNNDSDPLAIYGSSSCRLLSSALGVVALTCTMEMRRHREVGSLAGTGLAPLTRFFPTKNCDLSLRATRSHRRLWRCGQKLVVRAARRSLWQPSSCPLHWLWPELCSLSGTAGTQKITASNQLLRQPLWPTAPGAGSEDPVLALNSPCSCGPLLSLQVHGQLWERGRRLPAASREPGQWLPCSPVFPAQTQLPFRAGLSPLPATGPQGPHFPSQAALRMVFRPAQL